MGQPTAGSALFRNTINSPNRTGSGRDTTESLVGRTRLPWRRESDEARHSRVEPPLSHAPLAWQVLQGLKPTRPPRRSLGRSCAPKLSDLLKTNLESNLHIERKMFDLGIDRNLIKWQTGPEGSDDGA